MRGGVTQMFGYNRSHVPPGSLLVLHPEHRHEPHRASEEYMKKRYQLLLIAGAASTMLGACARKDAPIMSDTTAMTIDSTSMSTDTMMLRMQADSTRLDSARRADSIRVVDTLSGKRPGPP